MKKHSTNRCEETTSGAQGLPTSELSVLFVTGGSAVGAMSPFTRQQATALTEAGVRVDHFQIKERGIKGYLRAAKRLRRHLKEHPVPLIHAHYSYCGWVADLARRREKLVVSFIGSDIYGHPGARGLRRVLCNINRNFTCWHARLRVDLSLIVSDRMRKLCKPIKRYVVFPDGVDFKRYFPVDRQLARQKVDWPTDKKIVLFPANPARPVKNFPLAEQAVALLRDDQVLLKAFVDVPDELMNFYYNAADVVLLTSKHEGSPCVIKEAMVCNLPVVSVDVGDVLELVGSTEGCAVCPPDAAALSVAVKSALNVAGRRTNGRDQVTHLELSLVIQRQIKLYENVLSGSRQGGCRPERKQ